MLSESNKDKLTIKDLITTGVFTALFFVFTIIGGMAFAPNPVLTFLTPMGIALLTGPVYLLLVGKTAKKGVIFILGTVMGIFNFITGMYWLWSLCYILFGWIADKIAGTGHYRNVKLNIISFMFFSLNPMAAYVMLWINQNAFTDYLMSKGTNPAYLETMTSTARDWMLPAMTIGTLLCAFISAVLGVFLLRKQFEKAGITAL